MTTVETIFYRLQDQIGFDRAGEVLAAYMEMDRVIHDLDPGDSASQLYQQRKGMRMVLNAMGYDNAILTSMRVELYPRKGGDKDG